MVLAACAMTACRGVPEFQRDTRFERELPLAAPVAAFVVAEAMRAALPFADPLPYHGGAPATEIDRQHYLVRYELRGNDWLPAAEHRLLQPHHSAAIVAQTTGELPGYGFGSDRELYFEIRGEAERDMSLVRGTLPRHLLPTFEAALARGVDDQAALSPTAAEFARARELSCAGELGHARHHRDHALLIAADPALRAFMLRQITTPDSASTARSHARERLAVDDLPTARMLLHTARRRAPDPGLDYELLWQLHRQAGNDACALGCALLAREFDDYAATIAVLELQACGLQTLVDRIASIHPEYSPIIELRALPAATPLR